MKKYKVYATEVEVWEREYIVEAKSKADAEDKLLIGEWDDCLDGECYESEIHNVKAEEVLNNEYWCY